MKLLIVFVTFFVWISGTYGGERILLDSIKALTLYQGRLTNGRRSAPVPQLQCTGGTAGCSAFVPKVVQCRNMGSDGYDVQWECKTDMSNKYRFGHIQVNCEGYDHPNDPYVLRGSCGLQYTIDRVSGSHSSNKRDHHSSLYYSKGGGSGFFGNLLVFAIIGVVIYFIYKTCLSRNVTQDQFERPPPYAPEPPPYSSDGMYGAPPPPGFRPEYTDNCNARYRGSSDYSQSSNQQATNDGRPGFFSGAAAGALFGYLFGSRGNSGTYGRSYYSSNYGSSHCEPPRDNLYPNLGHSSSSSSSSDHGTRTASGFGGTSRR